MSQHNCTTVVLHCIDWRLAEGDLDQVLEAANLAPKGFDRITLAGAVKNLTSPEHERDRALALKQIELSRKLHGVTRVVLVNHQDCGAYGGSSAFTSQAEELVSHEQELKQAAAIVAETFPELEVISCIATPTPTETSWVVSIRQVG
jgi:carbonic anhydrase